MLIVSYYVSYCFIYLISFDLDWQGRGLFLWLEELGRGDFLLEWWDVDGERVRIFGPPGNLVIL